MYSNGDRPYTRKEGVRMILLRQSILNDYETCPYLAKLNWGEHGEKGLKDTEDVKNKYAEVGIIFHEVMEWAGRNNIEGKRYTPEDLHILIDALINAVDVTLFKDTEEIEMYRVSLHEQVNWALNNLAIMEIKPIDVEWEFTFDNMFEGCIEFNGTVDRVYGTLATKDVILGDYKTGKPYTKKELASNMQACIYSLAFFREYGFLPKAFEFYFTKAKKVKKIMITPEFLKAASERILSNWYRMKTGDFEPDNSNPYFCKNFCNVKNKCPKFKKRGNGWDNV